MSRQAATAFTFASKVHLTNFFRLILRAADQRCHRADQYLFSVEEIGAVEKETRNDQAVERPTTFQHEDSLRITESFRATTATDSTIRNPGGTDEATQSVNRTCNGANDRCAS